MLQVTYPLINSLFFQSLVGFAVIYEHRSLKRRAAHKVIYKKEMEFNFHPGTVYVIEVLPDIQTFRIVEDKTRFV